MQSLFHIAVDGSFSEMRAHPYDNEDHIQRLLAEYPNILGGEAYSGDVPRRWALIAREVPVPDGDASDRRWSLDHLYVDQDAIPTLVEVKRSRDTRSRREVIGQMFDYAANGPSFWKLDDLRSSFARTHQTLSSDPGDALSLLLGEEVEVGPFWERVEANLRDGKIRMIFLVDEMPTELLRIVEFLARQLKDAEVYAVEVRRHVGSTGSVLATSVLGQSQNAVSKVERVRGAPTPSEDEWFERFGQSCGDQAGRTARRIADWAKNHGLTSFTTSAQTPSLGFSLTEGGKPRYPLFITGNGKVYTSLNYISASAIFESEEARQRVADDFRSTGIPFKLTSLNGDIRIPITSLAEAEMLRAWLEVVGRVVEQFEAD
ncbi:hypothetical protein [Fulvimarina sp. MAC3]|uniref:hypothetical protein n=1 Tax=Fulvimarina sp. MAC3 TaxID=3148887 RepID=UPI0031FBD04E